MRKISQGGGVKVYSAVEGLKLLAQGKEINYEGASGPCDFTEIGDILDMRFRYEQAEKGQVQAVARRVAAGRSWPPRDPAPRRLKSCSSSSTASMAGTMLAVPAIGLTAIFAVLRFPNFALASHATIGAFAGYVANTSLGLPVVPSVAVAFLVAGLSGWSTDELVLKPFRPVGRSSPPPSPSIALTIALENVVRFVFGNELRGYDLPIRRDWRFGRPAHRARSRCRTW